MLGIKCDLKTHVRNVRYLLPPQIGGLKSLFRRLPTSFQNDINFGPQTA